MDDWHGTTRGAFRHLSLLSPRLCPAELLRSPFHSAQAEGIRGNQEQIRHEPCKRACEADVENSRQDEELVIRHEARAALDPTNCVLFNDRALCLHFRREGCL